MGIALILTKLIMIFCHGEKNINDFYLSPKDKAKATIMIYKYNIINNDDEFLYIFILFYV